MISLSKQLRTVLHNNSYMCFTKYNPNLLHVLGNNKLGVQLYINVASGGIEHNIDSALAFDFNPKSVPLSYTRLNSIYLPLRIFINSIS